MVFSAGDTYIRLDGIPYGLVKSGSETFSNKQII